MNVYRSGEERYLRFCESAGLVLFPTSENALLLYVSSLHQHGLAHSTAKSYLAVIRHGHLPQDGKSQIITHFLNWNMS